MPKKIFPTKYQGNITLIQHFENAKKEYQRGNFIEAFVILYSLIEFQLNVLWFEYLLLQKTSDVHQMYKSADEPKEKEYTVLVEILLEVGVLDSKSYDTLMGFKKGRNNAVHYLMKTTHRSKMNKKTLDSQFNQGLKSSKLVMDEIGNIMAELSKKLKTLIGAVTDEELKTKLEAIDSLSINRQVTRTKQPKT